MMIPGQEPRPYQKTVAAAAAAADIGADLQPSGNSEHSLELVPSLSLSCPALL